MMNKMMVAVLMVAMALVVWSFKWFVLSTCLVYAVAVYPARYIKGARK